MCWEGGPPVQSSGPGTAAEKGEESHEGSTQALGEEGSPRAWGRGPK